MVHRREAPGTEVAHECTLSSLVHHASPEGDSRFPVAPTEASTTRPSSGVKFLTGQCGSQQVVLSALLP